jgi:hypothetical protein
LTRPSSSCPIYHYISPHRLTCHVKSTLVKKIEIRKMHVNWKVNIIEILKKRKKIFQKLLNFFKIKKNYFFKKIQISKKCLEIQNYESFSWFLNNFHFLFSYVKSQLVWFLNLRKILQTTKLSMLSHVWNLEAQSKWRVAQIQEIFFFFLNYFFMFFFFDVLILKINFKNKKIYYFDIFMTKKLYKKQSLLHSQTTFLIKW